jgi:hypothetical protein
MARFHQGWLVLGGWLGLGLSCATAQMPASPQMLPSASTPVIYSPVAVNNAIPANGIVSYGTPIEMSDSCTVMEGEPGRGPLRTWLHNLTHRCWTTHNRFGCGTLQSECTFIFGSCRAFYGQPCLRGPPDSEGAGSCGCGNR